MASADQNSSATVDEDQGSGGAPHKSIYIRSGREKTPPREFKDGDLVIKVTKGISEELKVKGGVLETGFWKYKLEKNGNSWQNGTLVAEKDLTLGRR